MESMFAQPLNPRTLDPTRVSGLLEHAVESHPDRPDVDRFLRAGAEFVIGRHDHDPGILRVKLVMTESAPAMAAMRAQAAGAVLGPVTGGYGDASPRPGNPAQGAELHLIDAPARDLQRVNQG